MFPTVEQLERGAGDEVAHRPGHKHLIWVRPAADTSCQVDAKSTDVVAPQLDLAGVNAGADVQAGRGECVADCGGGGDGPAGAVECCEGAVTGRLDQAAASGEDLSTHDVVMVVQQPPPRVVTSGCGGGGAPRCR